MLTVAFLFPALARADAVLFIYPTLIIFEGNQRSVEVTIANRGDQVGTFETSWSDLTMAPDGALVKHEGLVPWSVQPHLRYSPRRVTLAPSESQVIKIALRNEPDAPEGEYFSHLRVLTINSEDPVADTARTGAPEPTSGISIEARTAVAIPVIWRNSHATPSASIESVSVDEELNQINIDVRRTGPLSVRGYLHVVELLPNGTQTALSEPLPLVIYANLDTRTTAVTLNEGVMAERLPANTRVVYSPDLELLDRSITLASYPISP